MSFEPMQASQLCKWEKKICQLQFGVDAKIVAPVPIKSVLTVSSEIIKADIERLGANETRIYGEYVVKLLYLDETDEIGCLQYNADFSTREKCELNSDDEHFVRVRIVGSQSSFTAREIRVEMIMESEVFEIRSEDIKYVSPLSNGFFIKDAHQSFVTIKERDNATIFAQTESELDLQEVCFTTASTIIKNASCAIDSVVIDGEIVGSVVGKKDGKICTEEVRIDFSEEIAVGGAMPSDMVKACVTYCGVQIEKMDGDGKEYKISADLQVEYTVCCDGEFSFVVDAYSAKNELLCTTQSYQLCEKTASYSISERLDCVITVDDLPVCDNILAHNLMPFVISVETQENEAVISGVLGGNIIYESGEENSVYSLPVSQPFSLSLAMPVQKSAQSCVCRQKALSVVRVRRGNEIEIKSELFFDLAFSLNSEIAVISTVSEGEEKQLPSCGFTVYFVSKGESWWDVARKIGCSVEEVRAQNPIENSLVGGEKIVVYRGGRKNN